MKSRLDRLCNLFAPVMNEICITDGRGIGGRHLRRNRHLTSRLMASVGVHFCFEKGAALFMHLN